MLVKIIKFRFLIVLLSLIMILGINACNNSKANSKKNSATQTNKTDNSTSPFVLQSDNMEGKKADSPFDFSTGEFGRENPFIPLVTTQSNAKIQQTVEVKFNKQFDLGNMLNLGSAIMSKSLKSQKQVETEFNDKPISKSSSNQNIKLTLIINGTTAVFNDGKTSKSVSVGDTIAEMKVLEIRKDEVVLTKEDKKYSVILGSQPQEILADK